MTNIWICKCRSKTVFPWNKLILILIHVCLYDRNKPRPGHSVNQGPVICYGYAIITWLIEILTQALQERKIKTFEWRVWLQTLLKLITKIKVCKFKIFLFFWKIKHYTILYWGTVENYIKPKTFSVRFINSSLAKYIQIVVCNSQSFSIILGEMCLGFALQNNLGSFICGGEGDYKSEKVVWKLKRLFTHR